MQKLSKKESEEIRKRLGLPEPKAGFLKRAGQDIGGAFKSSVDYAKEGAKQIYRGDSPLSVAEGVYKFGSGALGGIASPLAPAFKPVGKGLEKAADYLSETPLFKDPYDAYNQEVGQDPYANITRTVEDVRNVADVSGAVIGGFKAKDTVRSAKRGISETGQMIREGASDTASKAFNKAKSVTEPLGRATESALQPLKRENIINSQIAKAFNLAPVEDVAAFRRVSGSNLGEYMVKNNLLKAGVEETKQAIKDFNKLNYDSVRFEIAKVDSAGIKYASEQVPRYKQVLQAMYNDVKDIAGQEAKVSELKQLFKKKELKLSDIQRTKELIDDTYSIYRRSGEPSATVRAQGLDNIRKDLRAFIEQEVSKNSGADIKIMNRNVAATRELLDSIELRAGKPYTRSGTLSMTGYGLGGYALGGPIGAGLGFVVRSIMLNPEMRLKFANWLSTLGEGERMSILKSVKSGKTPSKLKEFMSKMKNDQSGFLDLEAPVGKDTGSSFYNRLNKYEDEALKASSSKDKKPKGQDKSNNK